MFNGHLPHEILLKIILYFYQDIELADAWRPPRHELWTRHDRMPEYDESLKTLACLSRASKILHQLATPYLYRIVKLRDEDARGFVRTMLSSLELRPLVQKLSFEYNLSGSEGDDQPIVEVEQSWTYQECLSRSLEALGLDETVRDAAQGRVDQICLPADSLPEVFEEGEYEDISSILLFILPSLECLRLAFAESMYVPEVGSPEGIYRCEILMQTLTLPHRTLVSANSKAIANNQHQIPAGLQHLRELQLYDPFQTPFSIKSTYPPLDSHEMWVAFPFLFLPSLDTLMLSAVGGSGSDERHPPVASQSRVKHLKINNGMLGQEDLRAFLSSFPPLESIAYETASQYILTYEDSDLIRLSSARRLIEAMEPHRSSLKHISLEGVQRDSFSSFMYNYDTDFSRDNLEDSDSSDSETSHRSQPSPTIAPEDTECTNFRRHLHNVCGTANLLPFSSLRSASLHSTDLLGWWPPLSTNTTQISPLLPASLQHLTLYYDHLQPGDRPIHGNPHNVFDHLTTLVLDVAKQRSDAHADPPNLRRLDLNVTDKWKETPAVEEELRSLVSLGRENGIEVAWTWHTHM